MYGPRIVTDGLVLCLDAGNSKSYPGSGDTWYDLSGNNRNYTIRNDVTWHQNYFNISNNVNAAFVGPPSNTFQFNNNAEHTIFCFMDIAVAHASSFFFWGATPNTGSDTRAIFTHFPWGTLLIYDVAGCCAATQRLTVANLGSTLTNQNNLCAIWRTRVNAFPNREIFVNGISVANSANNSTATVNWNNTSNAFIGANWAGKIYNFIAYNRGLSNDEISQNYNALKGRFEL